MHSPLFVEEIKKNDTEVFVIKSSDFFVTQAQRLLEWNQKKLTSQADLKIEDLGELFAAEFVVIANGRNYEANDQNYYEFLNKFRADIQSINYQVQEFINAEATVIMPLTVFVKRVQGNEDVYNAILLPKYNTAGKIIHWQEVYALRQ